MDSGIDPVSRDKTVSLLSGSENGLNNQEIHTLCRHQTHARPPYKCKLSPKHRKHQNKTHMDDGRGGKKTAQKASATPNSEGSIERVLHCNTNGYTLATRIQTTLGEMEVKRRQMTH